MSFLLAHSQDFLIPVVIVNRSGLSKQLHRLHSTGQLDTTSSILQPSHSFVLAHAQSFLLLIQETEVMLNLSSESTHQGYLTVGAGVDSDEGIGEGNIDCLEDGFSEFLLQRICVGEDDGILVGDVDGEDDGESVTFDIDGV